MNEKKLLNMKKEIDEAKAAHQRIIGHLDALQKELKKDWDCQTLEEAEAKLKEFEKESSKLETMISKRVAEIEEEWEKGEAWEMP